LPPFTPNGIHVDNLISRPKVGNFSPLNKLLTGRFLKNSNCPKEDLVKLGYKPNMKYKFFNQLMYG
jgi:hypothetical protein